MASKGRLLSDVPEGDGGIAYHDRCQTVSVLSDKEEASESTVRYRPEAFGEEDNFHCLLYGDASSYRGIDLFLRC